MGETKWRSEPTDVEESADELWLGVKCHFLGYERLIQVMHGLAINYKLPGVLSVY